MNSKFKKKFSILIILAVFCFSAVGAYATNYMLGISYDLDVYGYGADTYGTCRATLDDSGGYVNISGTKVRLTLYRNGSLIVDEANSDTVYEYYANVTKSASSSSYSNTWKVNVKFYYKTGSQTTYTLFPVEGNSTQSN